MTAVVQLSSSDLNYYQSFYAIFLYGLGGSAPGSRAESFYSEDGESLHGLLPEDLHHGQTERHRCRLCSYSSRYRHHADDQTRDSARQKIFLTMGEETGNGGQELEETPTANVGELSCSDCGWLFSSGERLYGHQWSAHNREDFIRCRYCPFSAKSAPTMAKHERTHTVKKPFACHICRKTFAQKFNLKTHQNVHTREKTFQCNKCGKAFAYLGGLKTHLKMHTVT
ncbi:hypothetical protein HPB47_027745 [Ixodes persulcatus]|uniref:Uncharacterized protein n=1 Tax=Ixodes persulcatus TaxID=34615 RepID=A0AC60PV37_IXOPE|nr:hypothetical protein HPB47_027745 [Ixodes persulcatus]